MVPSCLQLESHFEVLALLGSELLIALAYFVIPVQIFFFLRRFPVVSVLDRVRVCFIVFIVSCGVSHLCAFVAYFHPIKHLLVISRAITATVSSLTVMVLFKDMQDLIGLFEKASELEDAVHDTSIRLKKMNSRVTELQMLKDRAEDLARTRQEFLATVSHEVRTPLQSIIGFGEILQQSRLDESQAAMIDTLLSSARLLSAIINDILDFSRYQKPNFTLEVEPFCLQECVFRSLSMVAGIAKRTHIRLMYRFQTAIPSMLLGDSTRFAQILGNLLGNGNKFTHDGYVAISLRVLGSTSERNKWLAECATWENTYSPAVDSEHAGGESKGDWPPTTPRGKGNFSLRTVPEDEPLDPVSPVPDSTVLLPSSSRQPQQPVRGDSITQPLLPKHIFSALNKHSVNEFEGVELEGRNGELNGVSADPKCTVDKEGFNNQAKDVGLFVEPPESESEVNNCEWLLICVEDTGVGIPNHALAKVFGRFIQSDNSTTRKYGGTGLGLAICCQLVFRMNGTIHLTSEVNKGTKLWILVPIQIPEGHRDDPWLPATDGWKTFEPENLVVSHSTTAMCEGRDGSGDDNNSKAQITHQSDCSGPASCSDSGSRSSSEDELPSPQTPVKSQPFELSSLRVLVADDNQVNRMVIERQLKHIGITNIVCVDDGEPAYDLCMKKSEHFDCVLMDLNMVHLDGLQATERIRLLPHRKELIIFAFTAAISSVGEMDRLKRAQFDGIIPKPCSTKVLRSILESTFNKSEECRTNLDQSLLDMRRSLRAFS